MQGKDSQQSLSVCQLWYTNSRKNPSSTKSIDVNVSKAQAPMQVAELQKEENWEKHSQAMMGLQFEDHKKPSFVANHNQKSEPVSGTPWNIGLTPMFDEK